MLYLQWLVNKARGRLGLLRRALASLDLTEAQKTNIRAVFEKAKPSLQDLGARVKTDREALRAAAEAAQPDAAAVPRQLIQKHHSPVPARALPCSR